MREGSKDDGSGGEPAARQLGVEGKMALEVELELRSMGEGHDGARGEEHETSKDIFL